MFDLCVLRYLVLQGLYSMLRNSYPRKLLAMSIEVSLSHIFVTIALCGELWGKQASYTAEVTKSWCQNREKH